MLPPDWQTIDSLATLFIAVAQADAPVDRKELDFIRARLEALFAKAPPGRADDAIQRAIEHLILQVVPGVERGPWEWLQVHCRLLADAHGPEVLPSLVKTLARVTRASGRATAPEVELAAAIAGEWGLPDLAAAMRRQFQRAELRRIGSE